MRTKELLIIDVWKPMDKEVVGASELEFIRETILERFGTSVSPAAIARALADHGVRLGHPEILQADVRWRERSLLFTQEDLTLGTLQAATAQNRARFSGGNGESPPISRRGVGAVADNLAPKPADLPGMARITPSNARISVALRAIAPRVQGFTGFSMINM